MHGVMAEFAVGSRDGEIDSVSVDGVEVWQTPTPHFRSHTFLMGGYRFAEHKLCIKPARQHVP